MKFFLTVLISFSFFALPLIADKLVFKDGRVIEGVIEEENDKFVKFKDKYGSRKHPKADIAQVIRGDGEEETPVEPENGGGQGGEPKQKITKPVKITETTELESKMGLTLTKMRTQHFILSCEFDEQTTADYLLLWEKAYEDFCKFWQVDPELHFPQPAQITIFSSKETYTRWVEKFIIREQMSDAEREQHRRGSGLYNRLWYTSVKDEETTPSHEDFKPRTLHVLGHIMLYEYKQVVGDLPVWVNEGYASYCEFKYFKKAGASCVTSGSKTGRTLDEGWEHGEDWHDLLKETLENEELANFSTVLNIDLNAMTSRELAHAWSMNTFLIDNHPDKFRAMMDAFKERGKKDQVNILKEVFQWGVKDFEKEWHKFLKKK